ncbi:MAG: response regulator [Oscillospiraceae bacterium]|jgi:two-component system response regulator YesN|nr:response regulator [Oscillospiraceae bacterium]
MRVLIADDEPDVREGLKRIIDWKALGFEVCGEAANGDQCLQKILCLNPDLVLLDIRMPKIHGLKCARAARDKGWNGKIIILSGYSDFQYAQSAIQCGVETYLLKPIDEDELTNAVVKIREKIEKEQRESQERNLVLEKARNTVLCDILSGKALPASSDETMRTLELKADRYLVVIPEKKSRNFMESREGQELEKLFRMPSAETIPVDKTDVYLLKGSETIQKFNRIADHIRSGGIFLAVGREVDFVDKVFLSYRDAVKIDSRKFFFEKRQTVVREKIPELLKPFDLNKIKIHNYVEKLYISVLACNFKSICGLLDDLYDQLTHVEISPDYAVNMVITICVQIKNYILENYKQENLKYMDDTELISIISSKTRLYEIFDFMKENFHDIIKNISRIENHSLVDRVKIYIEDNYFKNVKIESLAQTFGYNSAYLGKILKNGLGESFHSYLDRVRIQHARELLSDTNLKVYEISQRVGYENIDYFYIKFHKYEGRSPLEYRKSIQEE